MIEEYQKRNEWLKGHVCYSEQINKAGMPNSETGQPWKTVMGVHWPIEDPEIETLERILRKSIFRPGNKGEEQARMGGNLEPTPSREEVEKNYKIDETCMG